MSAAGFPEVCGNVVHNLTAAAFANCSSVDPDTVGFIFRNEQSSSQSEKCCGTLCAGLPEVRPHGSRFGGTFPAMLKRHFWLALTPGKWFVWTPAIRLAIPVNVHEGMLLIDIFKH